MSADDLKKLNKDKVRCQTFSNTFWNDECKSNHLFSRNWSRSLPRSTMLSLLLNPWSNKSHVFWVQVWTRPVNSHPCWPIKMICLVKSMISRPPSSSKWRKSFVSTLLSVMLTCLKINLSKTWTCPSTSWFLSSRRIGKTSNLWPSSPPWENHNVSTKYLVTIIKYWYIGIQNELLIGMSHCYNLEGVFEIRIMSVLVYGGQGALGRVLVNRLKANYKVISVDLRESGIARAGWTWIWFLDENSSAHLNILACGKTLDEQYESIGKKTRPSSSSLTWSFRVEVGRVHGRE